MTVLADWQIRELAETEDMISPFVDRVVSEEGGRRLLSYGLSSYGYDIRLSPSQCLIFGKVQADSNVSLVGVSGTGQLGTANATGDANVLVTGVFGTGQLSSTKKSVTNTVFHIPLKTEAKSNLNCYFGKGREQN
ncbi:hypothetical protein EBT31_16715, partial [bacterium]|nr:hypothetical protein [bacterium]